MCSLLVSTRLASAAKSPLQSNDRSAASASPPARRVSQIRTAPSIPAEARAKDSPGAVDQAVWVTARVCPFKIWLLSLVRGSQSLTVPSWRPTAMRDCPPEWPPLLRICAQYTTLFGNLKVETIAKQFVSKIETDPSILADIKAPVSSGYHCNEDIVAVEDICCSNGNSLLLSEVVDCSRSKSEIDPPIPPHNKYRLSICSKAKQFVGEDIPVLISIAVDKSQLSKHLRSIASA